ncbi:MAG: GDSL family lipase [[Candidatus Thermochlorobacteriaceae] bacterium GBChlB]|nr:MAG: GDSL family lipase [[Candidatus Thermochlorobacteriaceae] bacterium GBChlB]
MLRHVCPRCIFLCLLIVFTAASTFTDEPKVVLFFGDSLSAGLGIDPAQAFPALIQKKIDSAKWNFKVINAGLSGETSAGGLRRADWLLRQKVDVLVLELGGNDALRGIDVETTKKNLQGIIDAAKAKHPTVKIVLAGMQAPPNMGQSYAKAFQSIYPDLAKKNNVPLIPFLLEGVGGNPKLNLPDGIHPTPEGHKIVSEVVWQTLSPVLKELR